MSCLAGWLSASATAPVFLGNHMSLRSPVMNRPWVRRNAHGGHCDCEQLAAALGCDPDTITFDYCVRVLQRHWRISCRHGCVDERPLVSSARHWKEAGPTDAVKAILISNAPEERE